MINYAGIQIEILACIYDDDCSYRWYECARCTNVYDIVQNVHTTNDAQCSIRVHMPAIHYYLLSGMDCVRTGWYGLMLSPIQPLFD